MLDVRLVEEYIFNRKAKESTVIFSIPDMQFIEGITNGKKSFFIVVLYHNGNENHFEISTEAWKGVRKRIEAGEIDKLWALVNSWGIYRG